MTAPQPDVSAEAKALAARWRSHFAYACVPTCQCGQDKLAVEIQAAMDAHAKPLRDLLHEFEAHEEQTHRTLQAILGADDSLEMVARRAVERVAALQAEVERLKTELAGEEWSRDIHANLNRAVAKALGKPFAGANSSWHDIPEQIGQLKAERDAAFQRGQDEMRERAALRACHWCDLGATLNPRRGEHLVDGFYRECKAVAIRALPIQPTPKEPGK